LEIIKLGSKTRGKKHRAYQFFGPLSRINKQGAKQAAKNAEAQRTQRNAERAKKQGNEKLSYLSYLLLSAFLCVLRASAFFALF
jgi:hypothetical protein